MVGRSHRARAGGDFSLLEEKALVGCKLGSHFEGAGEDDDR